MELTKIFEDNNKNLYAANVRDFQDNEKISTKIINTIELCPELFYIFHNGITFSCLKIEKIQDCKFKISNPQVINGCQTISSIFKVYKNNLTDQKLSRSSVLCRIYALKEDVIEQVCEANNTQVTINLWDLRSNDKIQKIFEFALKSKNISYKRKKGSRIKNAIFITELAQWIYSCKCLKPADAKNNKKELFDLLIKKNRAGLPYFKIFYENIDLDELVKICEIADFVNTKIKKMRNRTFEKDADLHYIAAIYQLERKTNWSLEYKFKRVNTIIQKVVSEMRSLYGRDFSFNKIFTKKPETWDKIYKKIRKL